MLVFENIRAGTTHEAKDDVEDNETDKVHALYAKRVNAVLVGRISRLRRGNAEPGVDRWMRHDEKPCGSP